MSVASASARSAHAGPSRVASTQAPSITVPITGDTAIRQVPSAINAASRHENGSMARAAMSHGLHGVEPGHAERLHQQKPATDEPQHLDRFAPAAHANAE